MIDEKKLIEAVLCGEGMNFKLQLHDFSPQGVGGFLREYTDNMKQCFVNLINAQPKIPVSGDSAWISTKEQLPKPFESVLINIPCDHPLPTVHEGYLTGDEIWISVYFHEAFTMDNVPFWKPLPEPPKGGEG